MRCEVGSGEEGEEPAGPHVAEPAFRSYISSSLCPAGTLSPTVTFIRPRYTPVCLLVIKSSIRHDTNEVRLKFDQSVDPEHDAVLKDPTHSHICQTHRDTHTQTDFPFCFHECSPSPFGRRLAGGREILMKVIKVSWGMFVL